VPKDRWEVAVEAGWSLWDGGRTTARTVAEEAHATTALAELDARLHEVKVEVADAFFSAALLQERLREAEALLTDLEARLREVRAQVAAGTALPGDTALVRAELLGARQRVDEMAAGRRAALDVLEELTGGRYPDDEVLVLPDLDERIQAVEPPGSDLGGARSPAAGPRAPAMATTWTRSSSSPPCSPTRPPSPTGSRLA
jgi:outer membrane protein TolC